MKGGPAQHAFTLNELVVAVATLAILGAFAVPRFVSLERQARVAATKTLAGSVRSSAALVHALWLAGGETSLVSLDGRSVGVTADGYPSAADIGRALQDAAGFTFATIDTSDTSETADTREGSKPSGTSRATAVWTKDDARDAAHCRVTYTPIAGSSPTIAVPTSGC